MINGKPKGILAQILLRTDSRIFLFFAYIIALISPLLKGFSTKAIVSVIFVHLFFVIIYGLVYFGYDFIQFFFSPILVIIYPINNYLSTQYLKKFKQNIPAHTVVILGQTDWFKLEGWLRTNFLKDELEALVRCIKSRKQDFSFYTNASFKDIEKIMADKSIKEVYFFGHGDSHRFQLKTDEILYYCEFNNSEKYGKEFVHQVHCGTPDGKSLIDYVVPAENKAKCFFFRKPINNSDIKKEFKRRTEKK